MNNNHEVNQVISWNTSIIRKCINHIDGLVQHCICMYTVLTGILCSIPYTVERFLLTYFFLISLKVMCFGLDCSCSPCINRDIASGLISSWSSPSSSTSSSAWIIVIVPDSSAITAPGLLEVAAANAALAVTDLEAGDLPFFCLMMLYGLNFSAFLDVLVAKQ